MQDSRQNNGSGQHAGGALQHSLDSLAQETVALYHERVSEPDTDMENATRRRWLQEARFHLFYLDQALATGVPELFVRYVEWAGSMVGPEGAGALRTMLECLADVLGRRLSKDTAAAVSALLAQARAIGEPAPLVSYLYPGHPHVELARDYLEHLLRGQRREAAGLIMEAADRGMTVRDIYKYVVHPVQWEIGRLWQCDQLSVGEEHYCTAATQLMMSQLYPRLFDKESRGRRMVATCVAGDLHEIGVRMVADFFEMDGWDTFYLGASTPADSVVRVVLKHAAHVLAISATIVTHIPHVREVIQTVRAAADRVHIMVGGFPFNLSSELYRSVGADSTARDADAALEIANQLHL